MSKLKYFINAIILSIGLTFSYTKGQPLVVSMKNSLMENAVLLNGLVLLLFFLLYYKRDYLKTCKVSVMQWIISLFLAIVQLFKVAISSTGGITIVYSSMLNIVMGLIILYSYVSIFNLLQGAITNSIQKKNVNELEKPPTFFLSRMLYKHPFITTFIIIIVCWLPIIMINYPSILVVDAFRQLQQYYGEIPITNAHPPIHTVMLGISVSIGRKLGDANLGLFLSNIPQMLMTLFGFSLTSMTIRKMKLPMFYIWINIIIGAFSPAVLGMLLVSTKDLLFTSSLLIVYNIVILYYIKEYKTVKVDILYGLLFIFMSTLVILFRKNGIYMMVPLIVVYVVKLITNIITFIRHKQGKKLVSISLMLGVLVIPVVLSQVIDKTLEKKYNMAEDVRKSEMLSIPFQQTARYVKNFPNEVTDEEKEKIKAVMYYDGLGKIYNPIISDPVKRTTPKDVTNEELKDYFKVWFQMFLKHPITYIESTAAQNYYLFSPENYNFYYTTLTDGYDKQRPEERKTYDVLMNKTGITKTENKKNIQNKLTTYYRIIDSLPVIGLLSSFSFGVMVLLALFGLTIRLRLSEGILSTLPLLMLLLTIFAGPVVRGYLRYGLPFIFVVPLMVCFTIYLNREKARREQLHN